MARLNEPLVAPDSIETLRRKFLRQNRDIARINSTQSLRIRGLENECGRMLSENLDLRGQILRLETELKESRAQRIADHAIEIKEKMEAQLLEWGAMLASLGHEPIPKNRSPRVSKKAKTRPSLGRSPPQWRRRNTSELENAALQEGRLPPLWENKPCPRDTMNREEILALCSEAAETTDSPDLGPPPVSRFVDEDPVKLDLPAKSSSTTPATSTVSTSAVEESLSKHSVKETPQPISSIEKKEDVPKKVDPMVKMTETKPIKPALGPDPPTAIQIAKSNLKRKMREDDEKENAQGVKVGGNAIKSAKGQPEKSSQLMGRQIHRIIKDPASIRREAREKAAAATPSVAPRKPLGSRNTNEAVNSPKKSAKAPMMDEVAKAKAEVKDHNEHPKDRMKPKRKADAPGPIEIPAPERDMPPVTTIELESEAFSAEPNLSAPDSPEPSAPWEEMRDTPPPTDISSRGETSRGSRRARTAVSYAEPNLRDKMRRPTKQLFDAVAGEGKAMRRASHSKPNDMPSIKSEEKSQGWKDLPNAAVAASDITASPLAQKISRASPSDDLPTAVVTDRKKRISSIEVWGDERESVEGTLAPSKSMSKPMNRRLEEIAAREVEVAKVFDQPDVYEFTITSPSNEYKDSTPEDDKTSGNSRHGKPRRQSSTIRDDAGGRDIHEKGAHGRSKKRSSMMAQKTSAIEADMTTGRDSPADGDSLNNSSPAEAAGSSARERASMRRRSMML